MFCAVEPKAGRHFSKVEPTRASLDFAKFLLDIAASYPAADTIHLVLDNLFMHGLDRLARNANHVSAGTPKSLSGFNVIGEIIGACSLLPDEVVPLHVLHFRRGGSVKRIFSTLGRTKSEKFRRCPQEIVNTAFVSNSAGNEARVDAIRGYSRSV